ncbi:MAG TPA: hypothetical protein VEZ14_13775 [Dehalococcoidia bacterium]|nr:hypothetical protein [Dehalococcoidia bacterium]
MTTLTAPANPGDTEIQVASTSGFTVGEQITINPGGANEESAMITGFASIKLDRPLQCAHQAGEFVEAVAPTGSGTCVPTPTSTGTGTATATSTSTPAATPTPAPCLTQGQKISLIIGIFFRMGAHQGQHRYNARFDVNHDGVIDVNDLLQVLAAPTCGHHGGGGDEGGHGRHGHGDHGESDAD